MLNLTSHVINNIEIVKNLGKFQIYMTNNHIDGYIIFGSGRLTVYSKYVKKTNKPDYDIVKNRRLRITAQPDN